MARFAEDTATRPIEGGWLPRDVNLPRVLMGPDKYGNSSPLRQVRPGSGISRLRKKALIALGRPENVTPLLYVDGYGLGESD
jgi:hypothetical protein